MNINANVSPVFAEKPAEWRGHGAWPTPQIKNMVPLRDELEARNDVERAAGRGFE